MLATVRAAALLLSLAPAAFPTAAALAQETRTPFQIVKSFSCQDTPFCTLDPLRTAQQGERLEITHVSCHYATYPPETRILSATLIASNRTGTVVFRDYLLPQLALALEYAYADATQQTFIVVPPGGKVIASVNVPNATDQRNTCSISGYKVSPP